MVDFFLVTSKIGFSGSSGSTVVLACLSLFFLLSLFGITLDWSSITMALSFSSGFPEVLKQEWVEPPPTLKLLEVRWELRSPPSPITITYSPWLAVMVLPGWLECITSTLSIILTFFSLWLLSVAFPLLLGLLLVFLLDCWSSPSPSLRLCKLASFGYGLHPGGGPVIHLCLGLILSLNSFNFLCC